MVRIVKGMKAKDHLGESIKCPICGEKLVSTKRHWCGARNDNYEECNLRKTDLKDNKVPEYSDHKSITELCRKNKRCNHELDDKIVGPFWRHKGNKDIYEKCPLYIKSNHDIILLKEFFKKYVGYNYINIAPNIDNPENTAKRVVDNYGFCINIKSLKELHDKYGDDLIYIMRYDVFDKYKRRKSLFRDYGYSYAKLLLLKFDDVSVYGYKIIKHNDKTGEYKAVIQVSFDKFLKNGGEI